MTEVRRPRRERGLALILVILVLTALVAIGTPFVISMKLQERGSVHTVADERAHLASTSARNHAVAHLFGTHESREREFVDEDGIPAHKVDDWEELQPEFELTLSLVGDEDAAGAPSTLGAPPGYAMRGSGVDRTLDAEVEDEQGKINLNTAMPNLSGNLLAGSHLSEAIAFDARLTELPVDDTTPFPADDDPDTVDGVVVILNPIFFTVEALSYRGKTETHLTGCFRGEYLSGTWEHQKGWPVFDLRGLKVFLHRYYDLGEGEIDTFRTPLAIREIADWSVIPYFLETIALFGLDLDNMAEFGLTPEMLMRAGLQQFLEKFDRPEQEVDEEEYRATRKKLLDVGIPVEAIDMLEQFRGKAGLVQAGKLADRFDLDAVRANAFKGVFEGTIKKEFERVRKHARGYFPAAVRAYQEIYDQPGLETFTATDFERIRDSITTSSSIDALWSTEQTVIGEIVTDALIGVPSFRLARYDHFNPGTLVRVRSRTDPSKVEYHLAAGAFPSPRGRGGMGRGTIIQGGVILKDLLKYEYAEREAMVSAMLRHPVNINTAPPKVLEAVLTGVSTDRFQQQFDSVTSGEARDLTDRILENIPITGLAELREIIHQAAADGLIDDDDVDPILLNAVNPNHPRLTISTTGFCYASGNVYTVEATGLVRSPAGVELASSRFREVIEVAPPDPLTFELASQDEWSGWVFQRGSTSSSDWGSRTTLLPGRWQHLMTTGPVALNGRRFEGPALDVGALYALTVDSNAVQGVTSLVEHFGQEVEGYDLENGSYTVDISAVAEEPMAVDLWVRPNGAVASEVIFDSLNDPDRPRENRVILLVDGDTRELVLRVFDDAVATHWDSDIPPAAEIRHELTGNDWRPDTWYHLTAAWGSSRPGDQVLMIDQRPVGTHTWLTSLSSGLGANDESQLVVLDTDFADRMPDRGSLWVGGEVIDYTQRQGNRFRIGAVGKTGGALSGRGRRGTSRRQHPDGTTVRPFGYSIQVVPSDPYVSPLTTNLAVVGTGGARLEEELPPPQRIVGSMGMGPGGVIFGGGAPQPSAMPTIAWIEPFGPGAFIYPVTPVQTSLQVSCTVDPSVLGFPQQGYLFLRYRFAGQGATDDVVLEEFVRYDGYGPGNDPSSFIFSNTVRGLYGTSPIDTGGSAVQGLGIRTVDVSLVSIETDVTDLSSRYPPSGVVQFTPPQGDVEWVFYSFIAEERFLMADPRRTSSFRGFEGDAGGWSAVTETRAARLPITPVLRLKRPGPEFLDRVLLAETYDPALAVKELVALPVRKVVDGADGVFVGLDRAPSRAYLTNALPRLRRFPTGELPALGSGALTIGTAAVAGGGGTFQGTVDEIRISQIRAPGHWYALRTRADGAPSWRDLDAGGIPSRDLRNDYTASDETGAGQPLDRLRILPVSEIALDGQSLVYQWTEPPGFSRDRNELLFSLGGEIVHGERVEATTGQFYRLAQFLPRLQRMSAPATPGQGPVAARDARREVYPEILLNTTDGLPAKHGFLEILSETGAEVLYYESASAGTIRNVQRGMFRTIVGDYGEDTLVRSLGSYDLDLHARGLLDGERREATVDSVLPLPMFGAARLRGSVDLQIPLSTEEAFSDRDSYVRFDDGDRTTVDEVIGYVNRRGTSLVLGRDDRSGRPLFRQRFGSPAIEYPADTIVIELMARYHDRYEPEAESPDLMMLERSVQIPGAHWDRITWEVVDDRSGIGRADVVVTARLDGGPDWDTRPTDGGGLYVFTEPGQENRIGRLADHLEFRISHRYRPGAWGYTSGGDGWSDEWKRAPVLDRFTVEYRKSWRVIHREDLPN